jgi:hypothetical protein
VVGTPVGPMSGTLVLANIYLTLLKGHHIVSFIWLALILIVYTLLSYCAWFKKIPRINWGFRFVFADQVSAFLSGYISYTGIMLLVSILSFWLFNIFVNILFPALIFCCIDYFVNKKYRPSNA